MTPAPEQHGDGRQFDPLEGAWWLTAFFTIWLWLDDRRWRC
jgi:hypothetical protein